MIRRAATSLVALIVLAIGSQSALASRAPVKEAYPDTFCRQSIHVAGGEWGVDGYSGRTIDCSFMRHWAYRWLHGGVEPPHYRCVDGGEFGTCDRRHSKVYFEYYLFD